MPATMTGPRPDGSVELLATLRPSLIAAGHGLPMHGAAGELIWSDLVKLSVTWFWFFVVSTSASHVPAGAARRDSHLAGTARSGQGRAVVWRGEANP